jgi:tetratricopeptide (TPR) repeat protein
MTEKHQEIIDLWIAGKASTEQTDWLWAEALNDEAVLEYMKTVAGTKKVLEMKAQKNTSKPTQFHQLRYWYLSAAIVLLSVSVGLMLKIDRNPYELAFQSIELIELQSRNIMRSSTANKINQADSLLNLGIKAVIDGKKKRAIELFENLITNFPEDPTSTALAHYNLGIMYFNSGKFEEGLESFKKAIDQFSDLQDEDLMERAMWFKAHTLANLNQLEAARDEAARIYHLDGQFRKQALLFAKKIDQKLKHKKFEDDFVAE